MLVQELWGYGDENISSWNDDGSNSDITFYENLPKKSPQVLNSTVSTVFILYYFLNL